MKPNLIIRASAGTGKTFSLATRFIRLMMLQGVEPKSIVALTFSRAAAREIYTKLLERLWKAASSVRGAADEETLLKQGLSNGDLVTIARMKVSFSPDGFAAVLRKVIDSQEVGAIATIDSFILRIVRSFPLEMGFQRAVDVLDGFGEKMATRRVGDEMLSDDRSPGDSLGEAFCTAQGGVFPRACKIAFEGIVSAWHGFAVEHPESRNWTAASMCAALGIDPGAERPSLEGLSASGNNAGYFVKFGEHLAAFDGTEEVFPKNKLGEMMRFFAASPDASVWEYDTGSGRRMVCDCGAEGANAVRSGVRWMIAVVLRRRLEVMAARLRICWAFEGNYDAATRRRGQLTFADFTRCQAFAEDSAHPLALENIQYRFDERFDHWALDEFQDTSMLQWICLRRLVQEAAGGEGRSVMVVGDLKQSIYGWRGGDDGPFREVMERMDEFRGEMGETVNNDISYRYGKHTADFINRVFGPGNLRSSSLLADRCRKAIDGWLGDGCWMDHRADVGADGVPKAGDYVEIVRVGIDSDEDGDAAPPGQCSAAMRTLAPKICTLVGELWRRHETPHGASPSGDTIGILVRNNADGAYLAECIRAFGSGEIPVVWEGANGILDAPAVMATLELLKLSSHPGDTFAWISVDRLLPVRKLVFPGLSTPAEVSRRMSAMLSQLGLSRTLGEIVARLTVAEAGLSARSVSRLESLVRLAVAFESRDGGEAALEDFPKFLAASAGRESGDTSRVVRILTIHRSKGLTLDHVIVPILESGKTDSIDAPGSRQRLVGDGWVLPMLPAEMVNGNPLLAAAWEEKANDRLMETLRLNYVALTRARKSTYVFVIGEDHAPAVQFRDLLLAPFAGDGAMPAESREYGEVVFSDGRAYSFGYPGRDDGGTEPPRRTAWNHAPGSPAVIRRTPSASGSAVALVRGTKSMAVFFSKDFGKAARHGTDVHAGYSRIEWIGPSPTAAERKLLAGGFREAFVKPSAEATVWRERSYEIFNGVTWESGQFDRVVFTGDGDNRSAVIYDFKTNARRPDESAEAFAGRMRNLYAGQMNSYRRALGLLTSIPTERIETKLLLEATGQSVSMTGKEKMT